MDKKWKPGRSKIEFYYVPVSIFYPFINPAGNS